MRKILILFLFAVLLSACNSSTLSFSEIEHVPKKVNESIDPKFELQLINNGSNGSYIIFNSSGEIESAVEAKEETVTIHLDVTEIQGNNVITHVYYLTTEPDQDVLTVLVNEETKPFTNVSGL